MENWSYRFLIKVFLVVTLLIGCNKRPDKPFISKCLETILDDYTTRYDKDSVIILRFFQIEDRTFFHIGHTAFYNDDELDGCFIYKSKLVLYKSNKKEAIADCLIDSIYTKDRAILKHYTSWDEIDIIYDGRPNIETYLVKSQNCIVCANDSDLRYREMATDTAGIRNEYINNILNSKLNNSEAGIAAIRFSSYKGNDYFTIDNYVDSYTRKNLSGCLKRNGRIVTFYNIDKIHHSKLVDRQSISREISLLNKYKEIDYEEFDFRTGSGEYYRIKPDESVEKVDFSKWTDEEMNLFVNSFDD